MPARFDLVFVLKSGTSWGVMGTAEAINHFKCPVKCRETIGKRIRKMDLSQRDLWTFRICGPFKGGLRYSKIMEYHSPVDAQNSKPLPLNGFNSVSMERPTGRNLQQTDQDQKLGFKVGICTVWKRIRINHVWDQLWKWGLDEAPPQFSGAPSASPLSGCSPAVH